jgi:hypothetical protein
MMATDCSKSAAACAGSEAVLRVSGASIELGWFRIGRSGASAIYLYFSLPPDTKKRGPHPRASREDGGPEKPATPGLVDHVDGFLRDRIKGRHRFGIGLESALRNDEV